HALDQERVWGIPVDVAIFTNLTQDHLDYHGTMGAYASAKARLFSGVGAPAPCIGVVNADDPLGGFVMHHARKSGVSVVETYGWVTDRPNGPSFQAKDVVMKAGITSFLLQTQKRSISLTSPLTGKVNVYNLLAAVAAAQARR